MRNRRAFVSGYLGTPGIRGLTGPDRDLVRNLVPFFELARSVAARLPSAAQGGRPVSVSAASSGETTLMATPVPSSKPAVVVALGQMWACQW